MSMGMVLGWVPSSLCSFRPFSLFRLFMSSASKQLAPDPPLVLRVGLEDGDSPNAAYTMVMVHLPCHYKKRIGISDQIRSENGVQFICV